MDSQQSLDAVIQKLSSLMSDGSKVKGDPQLREQLKLLQRKQKNLHLICVKEQTNVDELQGEISEICSLNTSEVNIEKSNKQLHKDVKLKSSKCTTKNQQFIASLREEVEKLKNRENELQSKRQEIEQEVNEQTSSLDEAKSLLYDNYKKVMKFEADFEECGKQLEFLKTEYDSKISFWEEIRHKTKHIEKKMYESQRKIEASQLILESLTESKSKQVIQMELYDQLGSRLKEQINLNQQKSEEMLKVNKVLELKLSNIEKQPQQLKAVLEQSSIMLSEKSKLLDTQINKIRFIQKQNTRKSESSQEGEYNYEENQIGENNQNQQKEQFYQNEVNSDENSVSSNSDYQGYIKEDEEE